MGQGFKEGVRLRYTDLARLSKGEKREADSGSVMRGKILEAFRYMFITNSLFVHPDSPGGKLKMIKV